MFQNLNGALVWRSERETLRLEAWGKDALRVRATHNPTFYDHEGALLPPPSDLPAPEIHIQEEQATLRNGAILAEISAKGLIRFLSAADNSPLLTEQAVKGRTGKLGGGRVFRDQGADLWEAEAIFQAQEDERFWGLGQHQHGFLDQKGCVIPLEQRNTEVTVPLLLSSQRYGLLWNNLSVGRIEMARNGTRWIASATPQIDYWITTGNDYAAILERYTEVTGCPPLIPDWALGFWQSKLRYQSQDEVLGVAREYRERGLPLSVIVIDFLHWPKMGEWRFEPEAFPDPAAMVQELKAQGVEVGVSVWPTVNADSSTFDEMRERGLLLATRRGSEVLKPFTDSKEEGPVHLYFYDATNPEAGRFLWDRLQQGYHQHGIRCLWLDGLEPDMEPKDWDNLRFYAGDGRAVGCLHPWAHQKNVSEGLARAGEEGAWLLCRSTWAGGQRWPMAVWSGDVPSTWDALNKQVRAGLNIGLSGIPWWTTDIGGYDGGDPADPAFRELLVRWFQWGVYCPLFRLHGSRKPDGEGTGGPNEVWSYGEEAYRILREQLFLRERLRPYLQEQARTAHERGLPIMRPLFFEFPNDPAAYDVDDVYLLGPDLLVAPILAAGVTTRRVYLPRGTWWRDPYTGNIHSGGEWVEAEAPPERIPVFLRGDARLPIVN